MGRKEEYLKIEQAVEALEKAYDILCEFPNIHRVVRSLCDPMGKTPPDRDLVAAATGIRNAMEHLTDWRAMHHAPYPIQPAKKPKTPHREAQAVKR